MGALSGYVNVQKAEKAAPENTKKMDKITRK
jgi:hypothetical protein